MSEQTTELLLRPDGTVLVHNLTPAMARLLAGIDPGNAEMRVRAEVRVDEKLNESETSPAAASS